MQAELINVSGPLGLTWSHKALSDQDATYQRRTAEIDEDFARGSQAHTYTKLSFQK